MKEKVAQLTVLFNQIFDWKDMKRPRGLVIERSASIDGAGMFVLADRTIYRSQYGSREAIVFDCAESAHAVFNFIEVYFT